MQETRSRVCACGTARVVTDSQRIVAIELEIIGRLQSCRDKQFSSRSGIARDQKIIRAAGEWFRKIIALGVRDDLRALQRQCALDGVRIHIQPIIHRRVNIRDFKDMTGGFDLMILDPLVAGGVLIDDDMGNILCIPEQADRFDAAEEYLHLKFEPHTTPCRKSVTRQVLEFGWPDPLFRMRNKKQRREEISRNIKEAKHGTAAD